MEINREFLEKRPLSYSSLKAFRRSPRHYVQYLIKPFKPTPAMFLGSLVDTLVLTPEKFDKTYFVVPEISRKTKAGREQYEAAMVQAGDRMVVSREMIDKAKEMVNSLYSHPVAAELLRNKKRTQVRLKWKDTATKLPMIGYVDLETEFEGQDFVADLKTATSADPDEFMRAVINYEYDFQAGTYLDGYHKSKYRFPKFVWIVVESSEPYGVSVIFASNEMIEFAKEEFYGTLVAFNYCMEHNLFNQSYEFRLYDTLKFHTAYLPGWKKKKFST